MKATLMLITGLSLLAFSSCKDCTVCTKTDEPDVRYCEKDFDSPSGYNIAIDGKETLGYTCRGEL